MKTIRSTFFLSSLILLSLASCEKDDDTPDGGTGGETTGTETFSCTVNGNDFNPLDLLVTGASGESGGIQFISASGVVLTSQDSTSVTITCWTTDPAGFQSGTTYSSSNSVLGNYCFGAVTYDAGATDHTATSEEQQGLPSTCTITSIDIDNQTWSGTFNFTAMTDDGATTYVVESGVFTNVEYD